MHSSSPIGSFILISSSPSTQPKREALIKHQCSFFWSPLLCHLLLRYIQRKSLISIIGRKPNRELNAFKSKFMHWLICLIKVAFTAEETLYIYVDCNTLVVSSHIWSFQCIAERVVESRNVRKHWINPLNCTFCGASFRNELYRVINWFRTGGGGREKVSLISRFS